MEGFVMSGQQHGKKSHLRAGAIATSPGLPQTAFSESQLISDTTLGLFIYVLLKRAPKQFFLNTHDDWGKALKIRCLGTRNRRRILDRLNTMTNIQGAHLHVQT
jgi:hypothetical protein